VRSRRAARAPKLASCSGGGGSDTEGDSFLVEPGIGLIVWTVLALGLVPVVSVLYTPLLMRATNGRTLGKLVCGIRVQRTDGRPVGLWWAAYREVLVKGVVVGVAGAMTGGIALVVDFAWPLWDGQNRAVHDLVVDSRVVRA
jgi:uncharacterized RDD family membrane protein YckC